MEVVNMWLVSSEASFLTYVPSLKKLKIGFCDHHAVCASMYPPLSTFECLNQSL
jgi:hypothetical protein